MKATTIFLFIFSALSLLFTGCTPTISNLTPERVPQNPSGIYTLSMTPRSIDGSVIKESYDANIVIDGSERDMQPSRLGDGIFDYDFRMPEGQNEANYYFVLRYFINQRGTPKPREIKSDIYTFKLANRYVISLEAQRAPVGNEVAVIGRGFSKYDKIIVGGLEAETKFVSPNALTFVVPALPAGEPYSVKIDNGKGTTPIGTFIVDSAKLTVHPQSFEMVQGERQNMVFYIEFEAPSGGLPVEVTTNVPNSVVMPEVLIPPGARSINVPVEAGTTGSGSLFVNAPGFGELVVPITVR